MAEINPSMYPSCIDCCLNVVMSCCCGVLMLCCCCCCGVLILWFYCSYCVDVFYYCIIVCYCFLYFSVKFLFWHRCYPLFPAQGLQMKFTVNHLVEWSYVLLLFLKIAGTVKQPYRCYHMDSKINRKTSQFFNKKSVGQLFLWISMRKENMVKVLPLTVSIHPCMHISRDVLM